MPILEVIGGITVGDIGSSMAINKELNRSGNRRGMSVNSHKNIYAALKTLKDNNHAKKDCSITRIQREMMGQLCPFAKNPTWTWAYALAEAGMRDALTEEKARENLKDRIEGKVTLPIGGEGGEPIRHIIEVVDQETKKELSEFLNK